MHIYRGKFDWLTYAKNDSITFVFPTNFTVGQPVSVIWQWTVDAKGVKKGEVIYNGKIDKVEGDKLRCFSASDHWYKFDVVVGDKSETIKVVMSNPDGAKSEFTLDVSYYDSATTPACRAYIGRLDWLTYASNELVTVVVPSTFNTSDAICAYWQWTVDAEGVEKKEYDLVGAMEILETLQGGAKTLQILSDYYTLKGEVNASLDSMTLTLTNPDGAKSPPIKLRLVYDPKA